MSDRLYFFCIWLFMCYHSWPYSIHKRVGENKLKNEQKRFHLTNSMNKTFFQWFLPLLCSLLSTAAMVLKNFLQTLLRYYCYLLDATLLVLLLSLTFQALNILSIILWNLFATEDQIQKAVWCNDRREHMCRWRYARQHMCEQKQALWFHRHC